MSNHPNRKISKRIVREFFESAKKQATWLPGSSAWRHYKPGFDWYDARGLDTAADEGRILRRAFNYGWLGGNGLLVITMTGYRSI